MAEEKEERDDASAGVHLKKFITDAMAAMDSMSKRMDAMEERLKEREDSRRKDDDEKRAKKDSEEEEKKEEREDAEEDREDSTVIYRGQKALNPNRKSDDDRKDALPEVPAKKEEEEEKVAADKKKKRKDDDDDRKDDDDMKARRKDDDDDDDDDDKRKDDDSKKRRRADSSGERLRRLEEALGDVVKVLPKTRSDDDYHAMCDVQARADEVYSALGQRSAPRFLDGEDSLAYRRRLVRDLKKHSPDWKDVNIHAITDDNAFSVMERRVYADAMAVAATPVTAEAGTLRAVHTRRGGHEITEYVGEPRAWIDTFAGPVRQFAEGRIAIRKDN